MKSYQSRLPRRSRIEADTKTIAILALMIVAMTAMICGLCYRVSDLEAQIVTMSR